MVGRKKNSTPEVRGNERFFYTKIFFIFDYGYFLEKWLQRHLEAKQFQKKFGLWSTQKSSKVSKTCSASAVIYFKSFLHVPANSVYLSNWQLKPLSAQVSYDWLVHENYFFVASTYLKYASKYLLFSIVIFISRKWEQCKCGVSFIRQSWKVYR